MVITYFRGLISPLIPTHEPPSRPYTLNPYRIPIDPFKGTLITTHEPPSIGLRASGFSLSGGDKGFGALGFGV